MRLAAKLIGWKIDIKSEEEKRRELEERMGDMVISGAPVSVLIDYGMSEAIVEKLVGAGIGTVEKLGSMTPEELEAISGIDEEIVGQISNHRGWRTTVSTTKSKQHPSPQAAASEEKTDLKDEAAPVSAEQIEHAIDSETGAEQPGEVFDNVETGRLEHDHARHEEAETETADGAVVLDLGRVEGLSGAPSALRGLETSEPSE